MFLGGIAAVFLFLAWGYLPSRFPDLFRDVRKNASRPEIGNAVERITRSLAGSLEILKPFPGSSLSTLVVKDGQGRSRILYLDKDPGGSAPSSATPTMTLYSYSEPASGGFDIRNREEVCRDFHEITFTALTPKVVLVQMTIRDGSGTELGYAAEIPLHPR